MPKWFPDRKVWGGGLIGLAAYGLVFFGNSTGWWHVDYEAMKAAFGMLVLIVGSQYQIPPSLRDRLRHLNDQVISFAQALPAPKADAAQAPVQARAPPAP